MREVNPKLPRSGELRESRARAATPEDLPITVARTAEDVQRYFSNPDLNALLPPTGERRLQGYCYVCSRPSLFRIEGDRETVNWRETLTCRRCGLINRWRSAFHLFEQVGRVDRHAQVFATEAVTPLFRLLRKRYPCAIGSEYRSGARPGQIIRVRLRRALMQDVTRLTFATGSFDAVLSFDVLEHVPDYRRALGEFNRVLRPGGLLLMSIPFTFARDHEVRAIVEPGGSVRHLLPPNYHRDPTSRSGVLCYQSFGTRLLEELGEAGFAERYIACFCSAEWGYLGENVMFVARKVGS